MRASNVAPADVAMLAEGGDDKEMKNIQVIDGADNSTYSIYSVTEDEFRMIFPDVEQDIEFIEDVAERIGEDELGRTMANVWKRLVDKPDVIGIHGTLFYQLLFKKRFYPSKIASEMAFAMPPIDP
jgi:hypothetical protein